MFKFLTMTAVLALVVSCSNEEKNVTHVSDIGLIHTEQQDRNFVAYIDQVSARLVSCSPDTPQPFTRSCRGDTRAIITPQDFIAALPLPTGAFPRTEVGLELAIQAHQSAVDSNQSEEIIKKLNWYRYNISDILEIVSILQREESVTYFNYDSTYDLIVDTMLRTFTDIPSQTTYRYIGNATAWEEPFLCSQLGDKKWKNVNNRNQLDNKAAAVLFNKFATELPSYTVGDKRVKLFALDGNCGEDRTFIHVDADKAENRSATAFNIQTTDTTASNGSDICEMEMPVICAGK